MSDLPRHWFCALLAVALCTCSAPPPQPSASAPAGAMSRGQARIQNVNLNDPLRPAADDNPIILSAAKNEWASFTLQISDIPKTAKTIHSLRIQSPRMQSSSETIDVDSFSVEQILSMPVAVNRAGFVRHTGLSAGERPLPRALLPVTMDRGVVNLSAVRSENAPLMFWVDLHVPLQTRPGDYETTCELLSSDSPDPIAFVPVKITIHDFVLPDDRHLIMTGRLAWDDLARLYPERFETVRPRLLSREDSSHAATVRILDALMTLAQKHRTEFVVPRLQPTVKWPSGTAPEIDWKEFDGLVSPWISGQAFSDSIAIGHWPLPAPDQLASYDRKSQLQYWKSAAVHFDEKNWLNRAPVAIDAPAAGRIGAAEGLQLSADAGQLLAQHGRLRVMLPLEEDQLQLSTADRPSFIDPKSAERLQVAGAPIIFNTPIQHWPADVKRPQRWMRTDNAGLIQYVGAGGDEGDVRAWAWLAFLRQANLIQWGSALPRTSGPNEPVDPDALIWFYPGQWFGVDAPLATVQLKWLRRAQQDYEYLWLAKQRGETINATLMARLLTKPVEIQPGQSPDPTYTLMTGTADPTAWTEGQRLLAGVVQLREPGQTADADKSNALNLRILHWAVKQDAALLMGRRSDFGFSLADSNSIALSAGIDIYNASDTRPDQNRLQWTAVPRGWLISPQPFALPALSTYRVEHFSAQARFDLKEISTRDRKPAELTFTNGFNNQSSKLQFVLPLAPCDRLGPGLKIDDGKLDDWNAADAIQNGPLVRMFNRPALQKQELQFSDEAAVVHAGWSDDNLYVAFRVEGISPETGRTARNYVDYQFRRAWGEDLCEILVQPIYEDSTLGPVLHIVAKPTAGQWVERKPDPRSSTADAWQPFEGSGIRYTSRVEDGWTGELAIPWRIITDNGKGAPKLLRFNFSQHVNSTGQSASWAGPIDFGRDDGFMGLLYLRDPSAHDR